MKNIVFFLAFVAISSQLAAQVVTVDNTASLTTTSDSPGVSSFTLPFTVSANNNRFLLVCVTNASSASAPAVTFNSVSMTQLATRQRGGIRVTTYYAVLGSSGSATTADIVATGTTNMKNIGAISFYNVDQSNPYDGAVSNFIQELNLEGSLPSTFSLTVSSRSGDMVVDCVGVNANGSTGLTANAGQTEKANNSSAGTNIKMGMSVKPGASPNVNMGWTINGTLGAGQAVFHGVNIRSSSVPDYTISTTGNVLTINDVAGNGETLTLSESSGNILFQNSNTARTYSINGGATTAFTTAAEVALAGLTSIVVNTAAGNDVINVGEFTANLPSLTINGGTGDDQVNFNGDITFASGANLDLDLQNDDVTPGVDKVSFASDVNIILSGTGVATLRVSQNVDFGGKSSLETTDGDLTIEANQQVTATTGNFIGVRVRDATVRVNGTGNLLIKGKGGTTGDLQHGVLLSFNSLISGGTSGTSTVQGMGGATSGNFNYGVGIFNTGSRITSAGGNVSVTGTGGGIDFSALNSGVILSDGGQITAGASGTVTVHGTGGVESTGTNYGISIGINGQITSSGGNVSVTGQGGGTGESGGDFGILIDGGIITAGDMGTVTIQGMGGSGSSGSEDGIRIDGTGSLITSSGGNVSVTGTGGGIGNSTENYGVHLLRGGQVTAGGLGTVTVHGTGGASSGSLNFGVYQVGTNSRITSSGGNVSVTGIGGGTSGSLSSNIGLFLSDGGQITAGGSGTVTVQGIGGTGSQFNSHGVYILGTNSSISSTSGNVSVTGTGGGSGTLGSHYGVYLSGGGQVTAGGNGTVTVQGRGGISSGNENFGVIIESRRSQITSGGGDVSITGIEGSGTSGRGIELQSSAQITTATNGGNITLIGNSMNLSSTTISTQAGGSTTLRPYTNGTEINLGTATDAIGGPLGLSDAELDRITTGTLMIGDGNSGNLTVSAAISRPAATNVQLLSGGDVSISGGGFNTNGGTLLLDPGASPKAVKPIFNGTDVTASTLTFGSDLQILINGATLGNGLGSTYTQLSVAGVVDLTGVDLRLEGTYVPTLGGEVFTIIANDGTDAVVGTFTGLAEGATIPNFRGSGLNATISYVGGTDNNDVVITVASVPANYTISTTGNVLTIIDVSGNGETLDIFQSGSNIGFNVTGRTYSLNGGLTTPFTTSAEVALAGLTSIVVNTAAGNDVINVGEFTANLPSLTLNGGTGDDQINFTGDISFAADANLDVDLQNDDATPGVDRITFVGGTNLILSGAGIATLKASRNVTFNSGSSLETTNGNLIIEANQQATATTGSFAGLDVNDATVRVNGTGNLSIKAKGGNASSGEQYGINIRNGAILSGGTSGTTTVEGTGGASIGDNNFGVFVTGANSRVTSLGGNVSVAGFGGGSGPSSVGNTGVYVVSGGYITASGSGTVTVQGGGTSGASRGVYIVGANSRITSDGGNVSVTGTGMSSGNSFNDFGIFIQAGGMISAGTGGSVTVHGTGSAGTGNNNYGVTIFGGQITSGGGNVSVTGIEGGGTSGRGIELRSSAQITTATNGGNITLIGNSMNLSSTTISTQAGGSITLRPHTNGVPIDLGTATDAIGGPLGLSDAELDFISTGTLIIGDGNSGNLTVSAAITRPAATNVQLLSGGDVSISGGGFNTNGGTLLLDPGASPKAVKPSFNGTDVTASTLSFGSDLQILINGTTLGDGTGSTYTQLNVEGAVNLTGVDLRLAGSYAPVGGNTFTIVNNDGTDAIVGTFNGLAQGATIPNFLGSGLNATISYTGGTNNNDVVITVLALPTAVVSGGGTVCVGEPLPNVSITLTGASPWTITYQNSNGNVPITVSDITVSPYVITGAPAGTYTVTAVSNSGGSGTSMTGSATVTVNPLPTLNVTPPAAQCGGSLNLSTAFSSNGTLSYFTDNAFTSSATNPVTTGGPYYARATLGSCTATASVSIVINPLPTISVTPPAAQCGGSVNLSTAFSSNGTLSYFTDNAFTSSATNPVTTGGPYYARANLGSCTATASVSISINTSATISVTPPAAQCGGSVNLSTAFSSNGTLSYFTDNAFTSTATNPVTTGGPYYARANLGSCTATASVSISINTSATISVTPPAAQCGGSVNLSTAFSSNGTLSYFTDNAFTSTATNPVTTSGPYYARANLGSCTATASVSVIISTSASVSVGTLTPSVCVGNNISLTASGGGTGYTWSGPGGYNSNSQNPIAFPANSTSSGGVYSLTVVYPGGCTASNTVSVSVITGPSVSSNNPVCAGNTIQLSASGGSSYSWSGPSGFSSTAQNPSRTTATTAMSGTYSVRVVSTAGCTGTVTLTVSVVVSPRNPAPSVTSIRVNGVLPNVNNSVSVAEGVSINFQVTASNAVTYSWQSSTGFSSTLQNPSISNASSANTGQYVVVARNGCQFFGSRTVNVAVISSSRVAAASEPSPEVLQVETRPNPFASSVWVRVVSERAGVLRFRLVDALGRERRTWEAESGVGVYEHECEFGELGAGIYLLEVENSQGERAIKRLVKQK